MARRAKVDAVDETESSEHTAGSAKRDYVKATVESLGVLDMGVATELPKGTKARARTNPFDKAVQESYETNQPQFAWVLDVENASRAIRSAAHHLSLGVTIRPGTKESDHVEHDGRQYHCVYFQGKTKRGSDATVSGDEDLADVG